MPSIHQLVAGYAKSDAISNEARVLRDMFRRWGFASDIYCETRRILPELRGDARDLAGLRCAPEDIALLHLSIGSPANDLFQVLPCRRVLLYHNITPSSFFRLINQSTAANLELGRRQACALSGAAHIVLADSAFNAAELREMGYGGVSVFPLALELESLDRTSPGMLRALADGRTNVLFVGRGAPNKKIEDVITAFAFFQRFVDPDARLVHAGSYAGTERYAAYVRAAAREAGIGNVLFTGSIPQEELNACYAAASVFVCMSEHEGFCIPLLEAKKAGGFRGRGGAGNDGRCRGHLQEEGLRRRCGNDGAAGRRDTAAPFRAARTVREGGTVHCTRRRVRTAEPACPDAAASGQYHPS